MSKYFEDKLHIMNTIYSEYSQKLNEIFSVETDQFLNPFIQI